jgi:hypothetical protein
MSLKEKKILRTYKSLFYITLILFIMTFSIWISDIYVDNSSLKLAETEQLYDLETKRNNTLLKILNIDSEVLINKDLKAAISEYQSLISEDIDDELKKIIDVRIETLNKQLADINKNTQTRENLISSLNRQVLENQALKDELNTYNSDTKNQFTAKNNTIDSLKNALALAHTKLGRKEKIQVLSFTNENGNLIRYLGEVKNDKANGGGVGVWNTGSIYKGDWKNNQRHGQGIFEWADGQKYEGNFENDIRTGNGTYYWPSGEKYVGEFENNRINGKGILYNLDGEIEYEGEWKNGKPKP